MLDEADRLLSMGFMDEVRTSMSPRATAQLLPVAQAWVHCSRQHHVRPGQTTNAGLRGCRLAGSSLCRCGVQVQHIVGMAPRERQTMLFSATMTEDVEQLVRVSLRRPVRLAADTCDTAPAQLVQEIVRLKVRPRSRHCSISVWCCVFEHERGV